MRIGGLQRFSLLDFPGKTAAVVFTAGCTFRCGYCHNAQLAHPLPTERLIEPEDVFAFLATRIGKLDGVVVTGGEPTIHADLPTFLRRIRDMGFMVKLDTNGTDPQILARCLNDDLVQYVALDLKSDAQTYADVCGARVNTDDVVESLRIARSSNVPYELRLTVGACHPLVGDDHAMDRYASLLDIRDSLVLQNLQPEASTLDPEWLASGPCSADQLIALQDRFSMAAGSCRIR